MNQIEQHAIDDIRLDGHAKCASLMDRVFARVEHLMAELTAQDQRIADLESQVRQLRTTVGGLVEHEQAREESETGEALVRRIDAAARNLRVKPVFADAINGFSALVPREPRD